MKALLSWLQVMFKEHPVDTLQLAGLGVFVTAGTVAGLLVAPAVGMAALSVSALVVTVLLALGE